MTVLHSAYGIVQYTHAFYGVTDRLSPAAWCALHFMDMGTDIGDLLHFAFSIWRDDYPLLIK